METHSESDAPAPWPLTNVGAPAARPPTNLVRAALRRVGLTLLLWRGRWRQRQALAELDERLLRDVGITRSQAEQESRKWFWQA